MTEPRSATDLDEELRRASHIPVPPEEAFTTIKERYLSMTETHDVEAAGSRRIRRRADRWSIGVAAASVTVALAVGAYVTAHHDGEDSSTTLAESSRSSTIPASASAEPTKSTTSDGASTGTGSQSFIYGDPTFDAFTRTARVANVIEGEVAQTESVFLASGDDGAIFTRVAVRVRGSRHSVPGSLVTVYEPGGSVLKKDLAKTLEGKFGELSPDELNEPVVERQPMFPELEVGERVLLAIGPADGSPSNVTWTVLTADPNGITYRWPTGAVPNPRWSDVITADEVAELIG